MDTARQEATVAWKQARPAGRGTRRRLSKHTHDLGLGRLGVVTARGGQLPPPPPASWSWRPRARQWPPVEAQERAGEPRGKPR